MARVSVQRVRFAAKPSDVCVRAPCLEQNRGDPLTRQPNGGLCVHLPGARLEESRLCLRDRHREIRLVDAAHADGRIRGSEGQGQSLLEPRLVSGARRAADR